MVYAVMTKHPIFGKIVVDMTKDRAFAEYLTNQKVYGDTWIEELEDEGEVQE